MSFNPHQWFLAGLQQTQAQAPNTFIGGVASTINTPALLASKLLKINFTAFDVADIDNFAVVGDDVQCFIKTDYIIQTSAFQNNLNIKFYIDKGKKLKNLRNLAFSGASNMTKFEADGTTNLVGNKIFFGTRISKLIFPELLSASSGSLAMSTTPNELGFIYIPIIQNLGGSPVNENVFSNNKPGMIIIINPIMATINGGGEDGDLAFARSIGAIIRYKTNSTAPNAVTDLSVAQVWEDAVKLTWTTPSGSTNTIESFDVYQNGVFVKNVTVNEAVLINLIPSTNYTFKLIAVDIFYNKSANSNMVSQTTNAPGSGGFVDTLVPKLISSYRLDNDLIDAVNGYNGTGTAITYGVGKVGNAAIFNGTSSFISVPDQNAFSFTDGANDKPFSYSFNVKINSVLSDNWFLGKDGSTTKREWLIGFVSNKLNVFFFNSDNSGKLSLRTNAGIVPINSWTHVVVTYDGSKTISGVKVYINGVSVQLTNMSTGTYTGQSNTTAKLFIGKSEFIPNSFFTGMLDAVHIFNAELTPTEIESLYSLENAGGQLI